MGVAPGDNSVQASEETLAPRPTPQKKKSGLGRGGKEDRNTVLPLH